MEFVIPIKCVCIMILTKYKIKQETTGIFFKFKVLWHASVPYKCAPHVCVCVGCSNSECVCPYMFKVSSQHTNTFRKKGHIYYREEMHSSSLMGTSPINQPKLLASSARCSIREASSLLCVVLWWIEIDVTCYVFLPKS